MADEKNIILSRRAKRSLVEIIDYYESVHGRRRASKVLSSIEDSFTQISTSPTAYPICFDFALPNENIRQMIVHNTFKIIYKIEIDRIFIIEVFHGSRNPDLLKNID